MARSMSRASKSGTTSRPQTREPWFALYWANPNETTGTRAHDNYLSFRTIKAAIAYGEKHFGETAIRYRR